MIHPLVVGVGCKEKAAAVARSVGGELAMLCVREMERRGAILGVVAEGGVALLDDLACEGVPGGEMERLLQAAEREVELEVQRPLPDLRVRTVVLVDDGTRNPMVSAAALAALRELGAERIVLVAPDHKLAELRDLVDEVMQLSPDSGLLA